LPKSKPHARSGADASFAKAMARAEFGRFYCDERDLQEVRRSLARGKAQSEAPRPPQPTADGSPEPTKPAPKDKAKGKVWRQLALRERRTELQVGIARLKAARKPPT
jgi:hypothetical protein